VLLRARAGARAACDTAGGPRRCVQLGAGCARRGCAAAGAQRAMPLVVPRHARDASGRRLGVSAPHARPALLLAVAVAVLLRLLLRWALRRRVRKARARSLRTRHTAAAAAARDSRAPPQNVVAFFHPFTNDGGGGERVLWCVRTPHARVTPPA
jgi:hypothetical protein